jgi:hypothetical protein
VSAEVMLARHENVRTASSIVAPGSAPDAAGHLLQIIERQPACLMRVDLEGRFLAVNKAALNLLRADTLAEALTTSVTERITATNGAHWTEFAQRVWNGAPGSLECSLIHESGVDQSILFHAIALPDHPDQIPSLLLTARDLSDSRMSDKMAAELAEARAALEQTRMRLEGALEEERTRGSQLADELRSELAKVQQQAEEYALRAVNDVQAERALAETRQQLESALEGRRQLQASLDESGASLVEQQFELQNLREDTRHLEPLAAAGRLVFAVSDEIQACLSATESCVRRLLAQNACDSAQRADLEVLRRDVAHAARLLRQIARLGEKP